VIERSFAVLSGIDSKLASKLAPQLSSMAIDTAFVKFSGSPTIEYFDKLAERCLQVSSRVIVNDEVRLTGLLVSFFNFEREKEMEEAAFFPSFRRIELDQSWCKDTNRSSAIAQLIKDEFHADSHKEFTRTASFKHDPRLLVPVQNSKCKPLKANYRAIYHRTTSSISNLVGRHVVKVRGAAAYRINDLIFEPALNDGTHPVRRRTSTHVADLKAAFRFGLMVPERFEFDVSGDKGLKGKTFALSDGSLETIRKEPTHLNMRVNDDFRQA